MGWRVRDVVGGVALLVLAAWWRAGAGSPAGTADTAPVAPAAELMRITFEAGVALGCRDLAVLDERARLSTRQERAAQFDAIVRSGACRVVQRHETFHVADSRPGRFRVRFQNAEELWLAGTALEPAAKLERDRGP